MICGGSRVLEVLALVLVKISLYASADFREASMLGRVSADVRDHLVGEEDPDLSVDGRELPACCHATEDGFLLKTFRDDFFFNSGVGLALPAFVFDLPKPKLVDATPLDLDSGTTLILGEGSRMLGLGRPV